MEYDRKSPSNLFIFYHGCVLRAFEGRHVRINNIVKRKEVYAHYNLEKNTLSTHIFFLLIQKECLGLFKVLFSAAFILISLFYIPKYEKD